MQSPANTVHFSALKPVGSTLPAQTTTKHDHQPVPPTTTLTSPSNIHNKGIWFEVLTSLKTSLLVLWVATPCRLAGRQISAEDGESVFLLKYGISLQFHTALKTVNTNIILHLPSTYLGVLMSTFKQISSLTKILHTILPPPCELQLQSI
jgi:hypothetical protein